MKKKNRLSQEAWLALALETVTREGKARVEIDHLAAMLGVTKGSFYSHFRDKKHFIHCIAVYWAEASTLSPMEKVVQSQKTGEEKLRALMKIIRESELEKYDLIMRVWALDEPLVAEQVEKVDMLRYEFVRSLFSEMGFVDEELEMRTMLFQAFHSVSNSLKGRFFDENRLKHEELRHRLFTQPLTN